MKTRKLLAFAVAVLVISCAGFAQIGFNQEERMMIEKYKASNPKLEQGKALVCQGEVWPGREEVPGMPGYVPKERRRQLTIKRDPRHEFAYKNLATIFFMAKQYDKTLGFLQQAEANGVKVNAQFKKDLEDRLGKK